MRRTEQLIRIERIENNTIMKRRIKTWLFCLLSMVIATTFVACESPVDGKRVGEMCLNKKDKAALDNIFSYSNPRIRAQYAEGILPTGRKAGVIASQDQLQMHCPDGVVAPEIDFENNCIILGIVGTPTSNCLVTKANVYMLDDDLATMYARIDCYTTVMGVGFACPYVVVKMPASQLRQVGIRAEIYNRGDEIAWGD
jgi:hypothetical protein